MLTLMLPNLDAVIVIAAALLVSLVIYRSASRGAVNRAQRRLYRRAFAAGTLIGMLVLSAALGSASGAVPVWLAGVSVLSWCLCLPPALLWLRRELAVRAREPYADGFS